ncbi:MAG: hypothetical protein FWC51_00155, partial [Proteobacteria bacterium]|nr:hypothetical protein [Pseudomonadota bacterium]
KDYQNGGIWAKCNHYEMTVDSLCSGNTFKLREDWLDVSFMEIAELKKTGKKIIVFMPENEWAFPVRIFDAKTGECIYADKNAEFYMLDKKQAADFNALADKNHEMEGIIKDQYQMLKEINKQLFESKAIEIVKKPQLMKCKKYAAVQNLTNKVDKLDAETAEKANMLFKSETSIDELANFIGDAVNNIEFDIKLAAARDEMNACQKRNSYLSCGQCKEFACK